MRVSPVGWFFETLEETLAEAKRSAEVTHNHPEGIKGAHRIGLSVLFLYVVVPEKALWSYKTSGICRKFEILICNAFFKK